MESEKVKEIKYYLEQSTCMYGNMQKQALALINELESENERLSKELTDEWKDRRKAEEDLHKAQWNYKIGLSQSQKRNKELKNRIAELGKENKNLWLNNRALVQMDEMIRAPIFIMPHIDTPERQIEVAKKHVIHVALELFAERLKEKLKDNVNGDNVDNYVECAKFISETLKELTGEENGNERQSDRIDSI